MSRIAILIDASDVAGETHLPGARVDIENWIEFLTSPLGGAWKKSEITVLKKPLSSEVDTLLSDNYHRYCFVAFSGHGSEGKVALNDYNKECPISKLEPKGSKGTLIIDSCRGIDKAVHFSSRITKSAGVLAENVGGRVLLNAQRGSITSFSAIEEAMGTNVDQQLGPNARAFMESLQRSSAGIVKMLACSTGETAGEDPNSGGYYSSALMDAAFSFKRDTEKFGILNTLQAHLHAAAIMPDQQNPEYYPQQVKFPFAVK